MKPMLSNRLSLIVLLVPLAYLLSSGPVLAISFWLREVTGWDGFYGTVYFYFPLLTIPGRPFDPYIEWWVELLATVGPG